MPITLARVGDGGGSIRPSEACSRRTLATTRRFRWPASSERARPTGRTRGETGSRVVPSGKLERRAA